MLCIFRYTNSSFYRFKKSNITWKDSRRLLQKIKKMPKVRKDIDALKEIRTRNKKMAKSVRFPPGEMYLCVLGNGSISSSRSLYMFTDHERYLFNCGEGTQRLSTEHKTKLAKLNNIFITHNNWENTGGLLGMMLTLQGMGVPEITLHGAPNLDLLTKYTASFAMLNKLNVETKDYTDQKFSDDCMDVHYIPIFSTSFASQTSKYSSDSEQSNSSSQDSDNEAIEPKFKKGRTSPHLKESRSVTVAFACKGHSKPGHLLLEKCVELGVTPGPLLGDLKNGKDITLPCGRIVHSKDVVSKEQHCPVFLIVECPSTDFLQPFVNEIKFHQYQSNSPQVASLVVHFTPSEILNKPEYQEWMNKFPESTCHLVLNKDNATLNSAAHHRIQHKLNLLHPGIFSLLHEKEASSTSRKNPNIIQANTLERYYLRPAKGLDRSATLKIDTNEFLEEAMQTEGFEKCLKDLKNNIHIHSVSQMNEDPFPAITFLGTGSSIPSKARNVSGILVNTSENNYIVLDCGEGTYGQIVRLYGEKHETVLQNLTCIFISHMHADHHLGLIKILKARENIYQKLEIPHKTILLIGPRNLNFWLRQYHKFIEPLTYLYRFIECSSLEHSIISNKAFNVFENSKNIQISTVPVCHCPDAHGVVISQKDTKWKIVYSGDTMPCERLVEAGENCSVLIHEATMEDELIDEAVLKKHSTTSEAIKIGIDMKSRYTILTHFSQRYAKIPLFNENFHDHVGCAFDNMTIRSDELYILPLLIPTLKCLFAEVVEEMTAKGDKRKKKIELMNSMLKESIVNKD